MYLWQRVKERPDDGRERVYGGRWQEAPAVASV